MGPTDLLFACGFSKRRALCVPPPPRQPLAPGHPALCLDHARGDRRRQLVETLAELTGSPADFSSAAAINRFLGNLLARVAHGLISRRDAAVQGYLCQLLLNTLPALRRESLDEGDPCSDAPLALACDIPRPNRVLPAGQSTA